MARLYDENDRHMRATSSVHEGRVRSAAAPVGGSALALLFNPRAVIFAGTAIVLFLQFGDKLRDLVQPSSAVAVTTAAGGTIETIKTSFAICGQGAASDCVGDGGSLIYKGARIVLDDVSIPRTIGAACAAEQAKGIAATERLRTLLSDRTFELSRPAVNGAGPQTAVLMRDGVSIGQKLIREGLAKLPGGGGWCG